MINNLLSESEDVIVQSLIKLVRLIQPDKIILLGAHLHLIKELLGCRDLERFTICGLN